MKRSKITCRLSTKKQSWIIGLTSSELHGDRATHRWASENNLPSPPHRQHTTWWSINSLPTAHNKGIQLYHLMIYLHLVKHTWDAMARGNYTYIYTVNTCTGKVLYHWEWDFFSQDLVKLTVHVYFQYTMYNIGESPFQDKYWYCDSCRKVISSPQTLN